MGKRLGKAFHRGTLANVVVSILTPLIPNPVFLFLFPNRSTLRFSIWFADIEEGGREKEKEREREGARGPLFRGTISRSEIPVGLALIVVEMERVAREGLRKDCGVIMKYRLVPLRIRLH